MTQPGGLPCRAVRAYPRLLLAADLRVGRLISRDLAGGPQLWHLGLHPSPPLPAAPAPQLPRRAGSRITARRVGTTCGQPGAAVGHLARSVSLFLVDSGSSAPIRTAKPANPSCPGSFARHSCVSARAASVSPRSWASRARTKVSSGPPRAGCPARRSSRSSASDPARRSSNTECHSARSWVRSLRR
jgi:hypothetical protein